MNAERPITREAAASLMAQVQQAIESESDQATVQLAGMPLQFERTAAGAIMLRAPGQSEGMRLFRGSGNMPADYPSHLPFVPAEPVFIGGLGAEPMMMWWSPASPGQLFRELDQQSRQEGWQLEHESYVAELDAASKSYLKSGFQRYVLMSSGIVSLAQRPRRPGTAKRADANQ